LDAETRSDRSLVIVVEDNLFLRPRIESSLESAGFTARCVVGEQGLEDALRQSPAAMLINVGSRKLDWISLVAMARDRGGGDFPIVGYGPHVETALLDGARRAGCSEVVPNGLVAKNAAGVIELHVRADE
jgi:CheY-like chemotaxis protein